LARRRIIAFPYQRWLGWVCLPKRRCMSVGVQMLRWVENEMNSPESSGLWRPFISPDYTGHKAVYQVPVMAFVAPFLNAVPVSSGLCTMYSASPIRRGPAPLSSVYLCTLALSFALHKPRTLRTSSCTSYSCSSLSVSEPHQSINSISHPLACPVTTAQPISLMSDQRSLGPRWLAGRV
jgi:hypothetical protein